MPEWQKLLISYQLISESAPLTHILEIAFFENHGINLQTLNGWQFIPWQKHWPPLNSLLQAWQLPIAQLSPKNPTLVWSLPKGQGRIHICSPPFSNRTIVHCRFYQNHLSQLNWTYRLSVDSVYQGIYTLAQFLQPHFLPQILGTPIKRFLILGPSGVGKTTLLKNILEQWLFEAKLIWLQFSDDVELTNPALIRLNLNHRNSEGVGFSWGDFLFHDLNYLQARGLFQNEIGSEQLGFFLSLLKGFEVGGGCLHACSLNDWHFLYQYHFKQVPFHLAPIDVLFILGRSSNNQITLNLISPHKAEV